MEFEDLKYDFPKMPEEMRIMVEKEVKKQLQTKQTSYKGRRMGRTIAASLAAILFCGTTVFAGVSIYQLQQKQTGTHGVRVSVTGDERSSEIATDDTERNGKAISIPNVKLEIGYLPAGMVETETGKYSFEDSLNQGGISMRFYRMDTGDDAFEAEHDDVLSSEEFTANGRKGIYLTYPNLYPDEITFNQRIYVAYTDVHYVMELYAASDVSKEEAMKIAENINLIPAKDSEKDAFVIAENWSDCLNNQKEQAEGEEAKTITSISKEDMKNIHAIGESFPIDGSTLLAKISNVEISDTISLLDAAQTDETLRNETDEKGSLRPATIQYIKDGDADSLSEEVKTRQARQKLVYATVEYTNTGDDPLTDVLFFGDMPRIHENDGQMQILTEEASTEKGDWDRIVNHGLSHIWEMIYYDVHGGERGNNYIARINPGETAVVHMAWIVMEDELETLFISLNPSGGCEFTDSALETGYVDIRQ